MLIRHRKTTTVVLFAALVLAASGKHAGLLAAAAPAEQARGKSEQAASPDNDAKKRAGVLAWQGACLITQHKDHQAFKILSEAVRLDGTNANAWMWLSMTEIHTGKTQPALDHASKSVKLSPKDSTVLLNYAAVLCGAGRTEEAISVLEKVTKLEPNMVSAYELWGDILGNQNKFAQAEKYLGKAVRLAPNNNSIRLKYAFALLALGKLDRMQSVVTKLDKHSSEYKHGQLLLARYYAAKNNPTACVQAMNNAFDIDPGMVKTMIGLSPILAEHGSTKKFDHWIAQLDARKDTKGSAFLHELRGTTEYLDHQYKDAIADISYARKNGATIFEMGIAALANAYFRLGMMEQAAEAGEQWIKINPNSINARVTTAIALKNMHLYRRALDCLNSYKGTETADNIFTTRAECAEAIHDYKQAIESYKQLIMHSPDLGADVRERLARNLYANGDFAEAAKTYEYLISRQPADPELYYRRADCFEHMGQAEKARADRALGDAALERGHKLH